MIDESSKEEILGRILASESFRDSPKYQKLLRYLVDASNRGEVPKEVTVAIEVFNKDSNFNPSEDPSVRVHIHNLRNRLNKYYETEGGSDSTRLSIPKGHYQVKFTETVLKQSIIKPGVKAPYSSKLTIFFMIATFLLAFITVFLLIDKFSIKSENYYFEAINTDNAIWGHFFSNGLPTSLVIGDFLVFHEFDNKLNRMRRIQDYQINEKDSLDIFIEKQPEKNVEKWELGELPHNSIFNLVDIYPVFLSFKQVIDITFTTEIDINFIKERNLIYIGEFKNLRALTNLIANLPIHYETKPWWDGTIYIQEDTTQVFNTFHNFEKSRFIVDLALLAKLPGQNMENYLLIAGFGYDSQVKVVKMLSTPQALKELEDLIIAKNNSIPDYFISIIKVSGFDRASSNAEVQYFKEILPDEYRESFVRSMQ